MRAGLGTILQTLTPEAASVLNHSIAEAGRRGHGQTTPLHVAATLLASPTGLLRQACVRSHPNTSHPLQSRALDLCFSVALDRLPAANGPAVEQPPISNALMAALKRAQANQRRGCPEQQQQPPPLLAVKVELEQLVVSVLDDPGVSRVMREASFSSPAVKATVEQSLLASSSSSATTSSAATSSSSPSPSGGILGGLGLGLGLRRTQPAPGAPLLPGDRSLYLNPRLQQQQGPGFRQQRDEANKVFDVMLRSRRRNPILVGDSQLEDLKKEVLQRIQKGGAGDGLLLRLAEVICLERQLPSDRSQIPHKLRELASSIDARFKTTAAMGVVLDLGDLKWLVETPGGGLGGAPGSGPTHHQQQQVMAEAGRAMVAEMAKLLSRFAEGAGGRVWLVGTATSATYLRCQVHHPTMEDDWDLQAVPISPPAAPPLLPSVLPRSGNNGVLGAASLESISHQKPFPPISAATLLARLPLPEKTDAPRREMCPVCKDSYEHELAKLVAKEFEKSSSGSKAEPPQPPLPPWLQVAKLSNGSTKPAATLLQTKEQEHMWKQTTKELLRRWTETCSRLHPVLRQPAVVPTSYNLSSLLRQGAQNGKTQHGASCSPLGVSGHGGPAADTPVRAASPPESPVRTDLVLGRTKPALPPPAPLEETTGRPPRRLAEEPAVFPPDMVPGDRREKVAGTLDFDSFKRLFKALTEKVSWQPEAASAVATAVMQCRAGGVGRRGRGAGARGDAWLLFFGPDSMGKKKMAVALSEAVVGRGPVTVRFGGGDAGHGVGAFRGKTAMDRVVEALRRDPSSVLVLENVDSAGALVLGTLKRAMERGRLPDSHGREVPLGTATFVLVSGVCEEKLLAAASSGWQLELAVGEKTGKRRPGWTLDEYWSTKPRKRSLATAPAGLSLDLNLAAGSDEDATESSRNSSDLTVEHEQGDSGRVAALVRPPAGLSELAGAVDEAVAFKPVDFGELRRRVSDTIAKRFEAAVGDGRSLSIDEEALDRLVGGVWFGTTTAAGFEEWTERVLVPGFRQLRGLPAPDGSTVVRLLPAKDGCGSVAGEWLPSVVRVVDDGPFGPLWK